jgi:hypothetical protein
MIAIGIVAVVGFTLLLTWWGLERAYYRWIRPDCGLSEEEMDGGKPEIVCAWCNPNDHRPSVSHGICEKHKAEMEAGL